MRRIFLTATPTLGTMFSLLLTLLSSSQVHAGKNEDLLAATRSQDYSAMQSLLAQGAKPDFYKRRKGGVVEAAICNSDIKALELLKNAGWQVDQDKVSHPGTALAAAMVMGRAPIIDWLNAQGASADALRTSRHTSRALNWSSHFYDQNKPSLPYQLLWRYTSSDLLLETFCFDVIAGTKSTWAETAAAFIRMKPSIDKIKQDTNFLKFAPERNVAANDITMMYVLSRSQNWTTSNGSETLVYEEALRQSYPLPSTQMGWFQIYKNYMRAGDTLESLAWFFDNGLDVNLIQPQSSDANFPGEPSFLLIADYSGWLDGKEKQLSRFLMENDANFDYRDATGKSSITKIRERDTYNSKAIANYIENHWQEVKANKAKQQSLAEREAQDKLDASLPVNVRFDMYMVALSSALKEDRYKDALPYFDRLEKLGLPLEEDFEFFYGEALVRTGAKAEGLEKLYLYLASQGEQAKYYQQTLELINDVE